MLKRNLKRNKLVIPPPSTHTHFSKVNFPMKDAPSLLGLSPSFHTLAPLSHTPVSLALPPSPPSA